MPTIFQLFAKLIKIVWISNIGSNPPCIAHRRPNPPKSAQNQDVDEDDENESLGRAQSAPGRVDCDTPRSMFSDDPRRLLPGPDWPGPFPDSKRDVQRSNQSIYASLLSLPSLRSLSKFTIPIEKNRFNADSKQIFWGLCCWFPFVIRCLQATPPWCGSNCNSMQIEQPMHGLLDQISLTWRNCYEITHRIHVWYIY